MEVKTKKSFNDLVRNLTEEIIEEDELEEMTVTGNVDGYNTPFAFSGNKGKKKKKKIATNSTNFEVVKEALDKKDLDLITKLIRNVVGDIYRDIWLKRNAWK